MGISLVSSFTGAASQNMACFIAGTTILTATGLVAIEKLAAGDKVISTNPDTLETAEKTVLETYVRQVDKLVHITINGEEIITTDNHPFYVQGRGFIDAGSLLVGDRLVSVNGDDLTIEDYHIELTDEPVSVYNFQVEDFHTYFVGDCAVWVHNKDCMPSDKYLTKTDEKTGDKYYTRKIDGEDVQIKYTKDKNGDYYPRFEEHTHPQYKNPIKADFEMTVDQSHDSYYMNKQVFGDGNKKMDGYTWHHLEDGEQMILVETRIHKRFHHQGGAQKLRNSL